MDTYIKTGIQLKIENECGLLPDESKWISVEWIEKELKAKRKEYPCTSNNNRVVEG